MRESNFYFPAHNKASVSITSALYDRRAIDATSPLPLLSTLTHLSYLTSTSPRIREILCSDGGLERLISILRSTGRRMREERRNLQLLNSSQHSPAELANPISTIQSTSNHSTHSINLIRISPFRPFLNPPTTQSTISQPTHSANLTLQPPPTNNLTTTPTPFPTQPLVAQATLSTQPLASHQIATLGLTKEQKQLLWTWSLSFQCVVNIGVRGTEAIRTRVVEAGVVPVIISVLGGYLHEMERVRQQSENHERARKKAALEAASTGHSRQLVSTSQRSYSLNADLPRPPRPVLSSRTLVQPLANPTSPLPISDIPPRIPINHSLRSTLPLPPTPSPPLSLTSPVDNPQNQSTASQSSSNLLLSRPEIDHRTAHVDVTMLNSGRPVRRNPLSINSATDIVLRTGSISPSSVSSSSSLETSRLHLNQQAILRNDGSTSSSTLDHPIDLIDIDPTENQLVDPSSSAARVGDEMDDQSVADESEADVVMELVGDDEAGPSSGRQRSRRGTIKASQANAHKVVHITPLAPPRPTLTELDHQNLPSNAQSQPSPMEGIESDVHDSENNPELGNSSAMIYVNHPTPRASSARLPHSVAGRPQTQSRYPSATERVDDLVPEDVPMTASSETTTLTSTSTSETDYSPPLDPTLGAPQDNTTADAGQLTRVLSDTEGMGPAHAFTPRRQVVAPATAPAPITNAADPAGLNAPTPRPAPPSVGSTSLSSPVTLAFRDEDVLLALQLLAYLSKYAHVRAYFHEPANRSTLELTYGSIQDATRALARFSGRFKSERYERERSKEFLTGVAAQGSSRRPASAQGQHSFSDAEPINSSHDPSDSMSGTTAQSHYPHRSYSSSMMRARMQVDEAVEQARSGRANEDPSLTLNTNNRAPSSDPGADSLRPALLLGGVTLFSTSPMVNTVPQMLRQPSFVLGQSGSNLMPGVAPAYGTHHHHHQQHYSSQSLHGGPPTHQVPHDLDPARMMYNQARAQLSNSNPTISSSTGSSSSSSSTINPLASNVFSYVERFTHQRLPHDIHSPTIPGEIQYWAGVIMRNACRKDETRGGIRQCANMQCGKWESTPREFAKCRRCRKAKYCSKNCQSRAWQHGHRFWCSTRAEGEGTSTTAAAATSTTHNTGTGEGEVEGTTVVGTTLTTDTPEAIVEDGIQRVDRASRALVDAAIERLRRTGGDGAHIGARRVERGDISEVGSNIATPPDREIRVENNPITVTVTTGPNNLTEHPTHLVHHHPHLPPVLITNRNRQDQATVGITDAPGPRINPVTVDGVDQLVDERDQIRLMVQNPQDDQIINP
ncbi:hypothetical protein MJO28_001671 [Puccinia striiformis f. sp. tritici]|uniref:MYND-type domain-containing protein n=2 Tax=Puccinia striiformis f. sp. tritici TaxID=168172 RepID=A0A0L0W4R8_9BASI|nr:hypothetical protein Pst134EA_003096 [Puccinia striiformis f. sp. tritici]KAH9472485.1 hypothetical protein Pst134EA_003096 [Puccinia striiformis f. sp. tritici]KAI7961182.1 hypothetical protein MJO28_001671 [Puccinia striiformis f. sp. tritici]KAI9629628.1 hypothetical protein KEM48_012691 [Puccinia striiformis f. sp. tritici PST-130]KNF06511.1 hypothetical protein PSTG_00387 [Puccinia striiformis f. sp. tritici PST-78]